VIGEARERYTKNLWTERASAEKPRLVTFETEGDQARYIVDAVLEGREVGRKLKDQAVLFRNSSHSAQLEAELTRRNVPYVKFGGLKFLDSAHVKDLLAFLRLMRNPRDRVAGFRVLQLIPGVGPKAAAQVLGSLDLAADARAALREVAAPPNAGADWSGFVMAMTTNASWPATLSLAREWYDPHLDRLHEDAEARRADLVQLEQIATGYSSAEAFLTDLTLDPPDATSDHAGVPLKDEDYLILSTIHSAKGQEWKSVYILNTVDGCIPSDLGTGTTDELEEERRLLYVAMTRARDNLTLGVPQRFYVTSQARNGDRHVYAMRTRFIPNTALKHFEAFHWSAVQQGSTLRPAPTPIDIVAQMQQMWE